MVTSVTLFQRLSGQERNRIWEILEFVELADKASDAADSLSHGERQWLELGMLIASNPKLLLLDEPTTGMTEEGKRKTAELIRKIAKRHTVLLVEHDMHIVRQIGQRITVLHQGQLLAEGPIAPPDFGRAHAHRVGGGGLCAGPLRRRCVEAVR